MKCQPELWRGDDFAVEEVDPQKWIDAFERLEPQRSLVVPICNAEAALYRDISAVVNSPGLTRFQTSFYTNLSDESMKEIRLMETRNNLTFYVSYHYGQLPIKQFIRNAKELQEKFNVINFHAPMYPPFKKQIENHAKIMKTNGVILDTSHEYLGEYKGELHYSYLGEGEWIQKRLASRYGDAPKREVKCRASFDHENFFARNYTVAPNGDMYICWRYLYNKDESGVIGNFFDPDFQFDNEYFDCKHYGDCNLCAWHRDIIDAKTGERLDADTTSQVSNTISACMIVRDEEKNIADCLNGLTSWVDELCIVDTGSTDDTMKITKETWQGRLVLKERPWDNDFSAIRNYSISLATQDWVFIIDADERIPGGHGDAMKQMLIKKQPDIWSVNLINYAGVPAKPRHRSRQMRLFKRLYGPVYDGKFHNRPIVKKGARIIEVDFAIQHYGDLADSKTTKEKIKRRRIMAKTMAKEEPNNPWTWYHYARALWSTHKDHFDMTQKKKIGKVLQNGLDAYEPSDNGTSGSAYVQLLMLMGTYKHIMGESKEAVPFLEKALSVKSNYLDALLMLAMVYTYGVDIDDGEYWANRYLMEQKRYKHSGLDSISMQYAYEREGAYRMLADIAKFRDQKQWG